MTIKLSPPTIVSLVGGEVTSMNVCDKKCTHIVLGDVAYGSLTQTFGSNITVLVQHDFLSNGRIVSTADSIRWSEQRSLHWNKTLSLGQSNLFTASNDLYSNLNKLVECNEIILWCGVGLEDQLLKIFVVNWLEGQNIDLSRLKVIQFTNLPNSDVKVTTIGIIPPHAFGSHPEPKCLSNAEVEEARIAWTALTMKQPDNLNDFLTNTQMQGDIQTAMQCLIRRFPTSQTGLNYWQLQILNACKKYNQISRILADVLPNLNNSLDFIHEQILFAKINMLLHSTENGSLLECSSKTSLTRTDELKLGSYGEDILRQITEIQVFKYDYWLGGIHLEHSSNNWFATDCFTKLTNFH